MRFDFIVASLLLFIAAYFTYILNKVVLIGYLIPEYLWLAFVVLGILIGIIGVKLS